MAGRGPAPKPADQRRNKTAPQRGEWVDLPPLSGPVLPDLPLLEGGWPARSVALWAAWRSDPVTAQYSQADVAYALETIALHAEGRAPNELRLRMDGLGLTPKGKRDLRWRISGEDVAEKTARPAKSRHLRAVDAAS